MVASSSGRRLRAFQVEGVVDDGGGYVEDVFGLAVAQLDASEAGYAIGEEGRRGREGVVGVAIVGHGCAVAFEQQAADDSGHVGCNLLAENGLDEGFEDGGGLADLEAVELFDQGGEDGVFVGGGVELCQGCVAAENPCQGVLDCLEGLVGEVAAVNCYFEVGVFDGAKVADLGQDEGAFDV